MSLKHLNLLYQPFSQGQAFINMYTQNPHVLKQLYPYIYILIYFHVYLVTHADHTVVYTTLDYIRSLLIRFTDIFGTGPD